MPKSSCTNDKPTMPEQSEEINDLKRSVNFISDKLDEILQSKREISEILSLVKKLEKINAEKDEKIRDLQSRVDNLEQYSRMENVIISGLRTTPDTHLQHTPGENDALEENVLALFNKQLDVPITKSDISVCHTLRRRSNDSINDNNQQRDIIVRFVSRRSKTAVMRNARRLKGTKIYVNEHLTTKHVTLAKTARKLQKENKIAFTWVRNCKVFVKALGSPETAKKPTSSLKKVTLSG